ncbi:hypothetical protein [Sinomicrobium weinanense]|uniref:Outer membrane protein beta-barrel domain-containing protein n=1 Tax=Sinomicrobium weinanense TaxID=2842200 RepID=A0A926Q1S7_9FLAO|nr:hypothetical protein [Sinomicrobium weinanense]MBC9795099.1 hypothetical protein [Sinomicrobium weinanense]MBU3123770.1 hypothetical protein [Sinomicrobium weinanense]
MRNFLFVLAMLSGVICSNAQETSVEKSVFGVQTGVLGIWVHNESRLASELVLRSEIGLDAGIFEGSFTETGFVLAPTLTLEPRYYYNFKKRFSEGRNTTNNSANFLALKINYLPDWFTISNVDHVEVLENISFIPKWGIKRSIGDHWTYEAGIGIGYRHYFTKKLGYESDEKEVAADLHLRIGYTF